MESCYPVRSFAAASVAAAGSAVAELASRISGLPVYAEALPDLSRAWFGGSFRPAGWEVPPPWDPLSRDYPCTDGWVRLHTNAPHHRRAALAVLGLPADAGPETAAVAVSAWKGGELEEAVVEAGGCAARLRTVEQWQAHPQGQAVRAEPLIGWTRRAAQLPVETTGSPERPLDGVRVLDLTRVIAGPVATRFLAGFGARVLRVDPPGWQEPALEAEMTVGKSCTRLDLRTPGGAAKVRELISAADLVVHGYRPGALTGLGLDEHRLQQLCPGVVTVAVNAWGWTGPWRGRRGFDSLVQTASGIADAGMAWSAAGAPRPLPVQALDHATGYLAAAAAVRAWSRRLDGEVYAARLSLARTAAELQRAAEARRPVPPPWEFPKEPSAPALPRTAEQTYWGPGERLAPPVVFSSVGPVPVMKWELPAAPLGSAPAAW
ncbi:CoA transferase [Arthrobacter caoxuetaonis]|uniref:CoA transferase n=1 Tax=Arthrobacter caoxuetaonis TaxID=2886935 RepID=A0A9X1MDJ5_9MICC|nr:CoA transferase [Arthrobacter caoxuetaonis]MCC3297786.1 CoA transferase [Arthrobacter caoxuetaonis]USQ56020.1 CoA transferase [Arthrobacter caoxuetaonis]